MESFGKHLTYANVMSTVAAFVAVAGSTAYASEHLGRDPSASVRVERKATESGGARAHSRTSPDIDVALRAAAPLPEVEGRRLIVTRGLGG